MGTTLTRTGRLGKLNTEHPHEHGDNEDTVPDGEASIPEHPHEHGDNVKYTYGQRLRSHGTPPRAWGQLELDLMRG